MKPLALGTLAAVVWLAGSGLPWPARIHTVLLVALMPALSIEQLRLGEDAIREIPRRSLYLSSAGALWFLAIAAIGASALSGIVPADYGLVPVSAGPIAVWSGAAFIAAVALALLAHRLGVRESAILVHFLPRTKTERIAFVGLSATAGICEELVFRGFLIAMLSAMTGSLAVSVAISTVVFGTLHAYQGVRGATRAAGLGLLLTFPVLATGSLFPSMIAHFAYDVVAGLWLGPWFLRESR